MKRLSYDEIRARIVRAYPINGNAHDSGASKRRRSNAPADELRRHGLLAEEGYAPGSWAAPRRRKA